MHILIDADYELPDAIVLGVSAGLYILISRFDPFVSAAAVGLTFIAQILANTRRLK